MVSVNERAAEIVQRMIADAEPLGLAVTQLPNGATVVDSGVKVPGSLEAGRHLAEICLGGLGKVRFCELDFNSLSGRLRNKLPAGDGSPSEKTLIVSVTAVSGDLTLLGAKS